MIFLLLSSLIIGRRSQARYTAPPPPLCRHDNSGAITESYTENPHHGPEQGRRETTEASPLRNGGVTRNGDVAGNGDVTRNGEKEEAHFYSSLSRSQINTSQPPPNVSIFVEFCLLFICLLFSSLYPFLFILFTAVCYCGPKMLYVFFSYLSVPFCIYSALCFASGCCECSAQQVNGRGVLQGTTHSGQHSFYVIMTS